MSKVFVVDEEMSILQLAGELLRSEGHQVFPYTSAASALEAIGKTNPELILLHVGSERSRTPGYSILQKACAAHPPSVVLLLAAPSVAEMALESMKRGAYDYLVKPFTLDELRLRIQRALAYREAISENAYFRRQLQARHYLKDLVGTSAAMRGVLSEVERLAETDNAVLICGPAGTGKELVARAIHFNSRRRFAPFVAASCKGLPDQLLESEWWGYKKGTFNLSEKRGLFLETDGGTILLDHVDALSSSLQVRLVRLLQEREVRRIGDTTPVPVDLRILAATEQPLEQRVAAGTFREDLFRQLQVVPITLPPLRDRLDDVPMLISHFLGQRGPSRAGQIYTMSREAIDLCSGYEWPGNVRELENAVQRACALTQDGVIRVSDLPAEVQRLAPSVGHLTAVESGEPKLTVLEDAVAPDLDIQGGSPGPIFRSEDLIPLKQFLRGQELSYLHQTLAQVGGSKERAAELLGISLATIYRKLSEPHEL